MQKPPKQMDLYCTLDCFRLLLASRGFAAAAAIFSACLAACLAAFFAARPPLLVFRRVFDFPSVPCDEEDPAPGSMVQENG